MRSTSHYAAITFLAPNRRVSRPNSRICKSNKRPRACFPSYLRRSSFMIAINGPRVLRHSETHRVANSVKPPQNFIMESNPEPLHPRKYRKLSIKSLVGTVPFKASSSSWLKVQNPRVSWFQEPSGRINARSASRGIFSCQAGPTDDERRRKRTTKMNIPISFFRAEPLGIPQSVARTLS